MAKEIYYSLKNILAKDAKYNMIIGERSNGKTYSALYYGLERFVKYGEKMAIVRRWADDFKGKRGAATFEALSKNNVVKELTGGKWDTIYCYSGRWYLATYDPYADTYKKDKEPFCYGFALTAMEHDKSTSYPEVTTIVFDEFLSRQGYLPDEFVVFCNVLSTIIRQRDNVKIFMLGNTVNKYCPYFAEMGLKHVKEMKPGDIDIYTYGKSGLTVAVEYCGTSKLTKKKSDLYFAFDNPKLSMITGGDWEISIYPHCPRKYTRDDIMFSYFIKFDGEMLQCDMVEVEDTCFTFIHRKSTEIKDEDMDIIFAPVHDPRSNWRRRIDKPFDTVGKVIFSHYQKNQIFYQDNEVGEIMRNYLMWSLQDSVIIK